MINEFPIVALLIAIQVEPAHAITVLQGQAVRDSYALSGNDLLPGGYLVQFSGDLIDPGDSLSISLRDTGLNLLGFTRFSLDASQTTGRSSVFLNIDRDDFAPSIGPFDPVRIPSAGFIEFEPVKGFFDLSAKTLSATDRTAFPFPLAQDRLVDFTRVTMEPSPAPVPLPAPFLFLLTAVAGLVATMAQGRRRLSF